MAFHYTSRESGAWGEATEQRFASLGGITAYGAIGVHVFFLISGFVILMSAWGRDLPDFIASRVGRLFPAFWFAVLATSLVVLLLAPDGPAGKSDLGFKDALSNLSMVHPSMGTPHVDGVYWTLWAELKFYVIVAVLLHFGLTRGRVLALAVLWPLLGQLADLSGSSLLVQILMPSYAPLFAIGMMLYLIHREGPSTVTVLVMAMNWTFVLQLSDDAYRSTIVDNSVWDVSGSVIAGIITLAMALILLLTSEPVRRRTDWRWLTTLGALTYPLYLLHERIGWWLISVFDGRFALPTYVTLAIVVTAMCLAAAAVYRWIEKPLSRRLKRAVRQSL